MLWRSRRGTERAPRFLLLIVYLAGISIGNHLLALLAGAGRAAVPGRHAAARAGARSGRSAARSGGRSRWSPACGRCWSAPGSAARRSPRSARLCFLAAAVFAAAGGAGAFALAGPGDRGSRHHAVRVRLSPLGAASDRSTRPRPPPSTRCSPCIRRAQYPPRTPLDDPTVLHGPGQPGPHAHADRLRSSPNYFQYFDWQWARVAGRRRRGSRSRCLFFDPGPARPAGSSGAPTGRPGGCCSASSWSPGSGWCST